MDTQLLIPVADPVPLPAPIWLFQLLLLVTFTLHIVLMNLMLGGGISATILKLFGKETDFSKRLFEDVTKKVPTLLAATVTLGVAPLLFLQVLYGQLMYTSSIIIGWPWFSVIILVILAYYGFYLVAFNNKRSGKAVGWGMLASVLLIMIIGFIYTNNMTLMLTPSAFAAKYFADPTGWNLNTAEPTVIPRYLHFMTAAAAVGGLLIAYIGKINWDKDKEYSLYVMRFGGRVFLYITMAQVVIGLWFLLSLPRENMLIFMGQDILATMMFALGFILTIVVLFLFARSLRSDDPRKGVMITIAVTAVIIILMVIMRDALRSSYLKDVFSLESFAISTQWDLLGLFLVLFIGGIILWVQMVRRYFKTA